MTAMHFTATTSRDNQTRIKKGRPLRTALLPNEADASALQPTGIRLTP